ncbi:MAG: PEGA domain-containing protein [Deltaproteobacteria bacterium]|nr:PEGA domain-containing protein [Deltaproteobacteria bacterium]
MRQLIRAALYREPLKEDPGPVGRAIFEILQGPAHAPMAWASAVAGIVALVFLAVGKLAVPSTITIESQPAGATVLLDGEDRGATPLVLKGLDRGRYSVEVRLADHQSRLIAADVHAFAPSHYLATLIPVPRTEAGESHVQPQSLTQIFGPPTLELAKKPGLRREARAGAMLSRR